MKKFYTFVLLLLFLTNFTSCGYQLRGVEGLNFKSVSIVGGSPDFTKLLKKKFKQAGVKVQEENSGKNLEIINDNFSRKILSLSSAGKVKEYQINYKVVFRIKTRDGEWSAPINIEIDRDYTFDDKNIIAKTEEELRILQSIQERLIRTIVTRLSVQK